MKKMMSMVVGVLLAAPVSHAQEEFAYVCMNGDLQRRVEVVHETGVSVPCEVHYYKDTEAPGEQQVLWRAQNEEGYCEAQARGFVDQLVAWGWSCSAAAEDAADANDEN